MAKGKIEIQPGATPEKHELKTAEVLANAGNNVLFLKPSQTKNVRTPDIRMKGIEWEIKRPKANSKYTIEHAFRSALGQSENVIFDLRSNKTPAQALRRAEKEFKREPRAKKLIIINRGGKMLDVKR